MPKSTKMLPVFDREQFAEMRVMKKRKIEGDLRMYKKLFLTLLLILALALVACGGDEEEEPAEETTVEEPAAEEEAAEEAPAEELSPIEEWAKGVNDELGGTEIKIAAASHPSTEAFKKMTPRFEELTGIKVVIDEMEEGALGQKLLLEMSAPTSDYDIIMSLVTFQQILSPHDHTSGILPFDNQVAFIYDCFIFK